MGDTHDNTEYQNPVSPTGAQPVPPETFAPSAGEAEPASDALYRQDIRAGLSEEEAAANADERAQENRAAAGQEPVGDEWTAGTPEPPAPGQEPGDEAAADMQRSGQPDESDR